MKPRVLAILILISIGFSLQIYPTTIYKGESFTINTDSTGNLIILIGNCTIFNDTISGNFIYTTDYLTPSGTLQVLFNNESQNVLVLPTRNSSLLLISIVSPANNVFQRTEQINLFVNITRAGQPVNVSAFVFFDKKYSLQNDNGLYFIKLNISKDFPLGKYTLYITAGNESLGGQKNLNISIVKAKPAIQIISPLEDVYQIGSNLNLKANITYPSGSPFDGDVYAVFKDKNISFKKYNNLYFANISFLPELYGLLKIKIIAVDEYGNSNSKQILIQTTGLYSYYFKKYWYIWISILALLVLILYFLNKKISTSLTLKHLINEKKKLIEKKKSLQKDYFINKVIDRETFDEEENKIDEHISIIEDKIRRLKK